MLKDSLILREISGGTQVEVRKFMSLIGGSSLTDGGSGSSSRRSIFMRTLVFVAGFSAVFIGLGLFYREGYFMQTVNHDNWQTEYFSLLNPRNLPLEPVLDARGAWSGAVLAGREALRAQAVSQQHSLSRWTGRRLAGYLTRLP